MNKIYSFITISASVLSFAQSTISFETTEGYTLGDINGQNGWTVTERNGAALTNQVISDEVAKTGSNSFKNAYLDGVDPQWFPIIGIEKTFNQHLDYKAATISYDFRANLQGESDFEFAIYGINQAEQAYDTLFALGFENRGYIYLWTEPNFGGFQYATPKWNINQWYNMKIEITEDKIICYLDGVEIYNGANTSKVNVEGFNFLHNNYGGDAYYDNIKINNEDLATWEAKNNKGISVYPNPAKDFFMINSPSQADYTIYNTIGQSVQQGKAQGKVDIQSLKPGVYIVQVKTEDNKVESTKLIKK